MSMLIRSRATRLSAAVATAAISLGVFAGPAAAQGNQNGLVNVSVTDVLNNNQVSVQVPIGVAANVCGVNVGVIQDARNQGITPDCSSSTTQDLPVAFRP